MRGSKMQIKPHLLSVIAEKRLIALYLLVPFVQYRVAFLLLVLAYGLLFWKKYRLFVTGERIIIRKGLLTEQITEIPKRSITAYCVEKSLFLMLFGARTLKIYTESKKGDKPTATLRLGARGIKRILTFIGYETPQTAVKIPVIRTVLFALSSSSAVLGFFLAVPVINRTGKLLGVALSELLLERLNEVSQNGIIPSFVNALSLLFISFYFVSFCVNLSKGLFARVSHAKGRDFFTRGVLVRKKTAFKDRFVTSVCATKPLLLRMFGRGHLSADCVGLGANDVLLPSIKLPSRKERLFAKKGTKYRFFRWRLTALAVLFPVNRMLVALFPSFSQLITFLCLVAAAYLLYLLGLSSYAHKKAGLSADAHTIRMTAVGGTQVKDVQFIAERIAEIRIIRYPADILEGTCTVKITAYGTGRSAKVRCLSYASVTDILQTLGKDIKKEERKC